MIPVDFVNWLLPYAKNIETKYGIPHLFIIAQAALESGWGKSAIGQNLFGIKAGASWSGKKKLVKTTEFLSKPNVKFPVVLSVTKVPSGKYKYVVEDWFRDYDSVEQCLIDHANVLMLPHFIHAIGIMDPYEFAKAIQDTSRTGGKVYATAPNYPESIKAVVQTIKRNMK